MLLHRQRPDSISELLGQLQILQVPPTALHPRARHVSRNSEHSAAASVSFLRQRDQAAADCAGASWPHRCGPPGSCGVAVVESVPPDNAVAAHEAAIPLDPALINPVTPQAALGPVPAGAVVAPEALPPLDPATAAAGIAPVALDSEVVTPVVAALPVGSAVDAAGVYAQAVTLPAGTAYVAGTLGVGYSGSGFLVSERQGLQLV